MPDAFSGPAGLVRYGFIGLGHQGSPMAERMISGGLRPWLWARRASILERDRDTDAQLGRSASEVGANVQRLLAGAEIGQPKRR